MAEAKKAKVVIVEAVKAVAEVTKTTRTLTLNKDEVGMLAKLVGRTSGSVGKLKYNMTDRESMTIYEVHPVLLKLL